MKKFEVHEILTFHNVHFIEAETEEEATNAVENGDTNYAQREISQSIISVDKIKKSTDDHERSVFWTKKGYF